MMGSSCCQGQQGNSLVNSQIPAITELPIPPVLQYKMKIIAHSPIADFCVDVLFRFFCFDESKEQGPIETKFE